MTAVNPFHGHGAPRCERGQRGRHVDVAQVAERLAKLARIARLVSKVQLFHHAGGHKIENRQQVAVPKATLDGLQRRNQDRAIEKTAPQRVRPLDLDSDLEAFVSRAPVDLAKRGGGNARVAQRSKEGWPIRVASGRRRNARSDRPSRIELLRYHLVRKLIWKRSIRGLQRFEGLTDLLGQNVGSLRKRLPDLHRHGTKLGELIA